jgi:hypothetical protein
LLPAPVKGASATSIVPVRGIVWLPSVTVVVSVYSPSSALTG